MKKLLLVANVAKEHIRKFYVPFIIQLQKHGWSVDIACRMDVAVPECDNAYDLPCDRNPFHGGIGRSVNTLKKILSENDYELLLCSTVVGSIVARLAASSFRKKGLKVIYLCHGLHFFPGASVSRWVMGYPMEKLLTPSTDAIIVTNDTDLYTVKKYLNTPNVVKSHSMGVDLTRFRDATLSDYERIELRRKIGIASDDFVLAYVAEIIDNKNQMMLVDAFRRIQMTVPNTKLLLIGPEHDGGALRRFVESEGLGASILFLGWRSDVPTLLHLADVYVASSKSEGLGLNLIEAMACGLPVIATKNRGHAESIRHGYTGFLVEQNDSKDMAEYVLRIFDDTLLRKTITTQAQQEIEKYGTEAALMELEEILEHYL